MKNRKKIIIVLIVILLLGSVFSISKIPKSFKRKKENKINEDRKNIEKDKKIKENNDDNKDNNDSKNNKIEENPKPSNETDSSSKDKEKPSKPVIPSVLKPNPKPTPTPKPTPKPNPKPNPTPTPNPPNPDPNPNPPVTPEPPTPLQEIDAGKSVKRTYLKEGKKITTLWVQGLNPPERSEFKEEKYNDYLIVTTPYKPNRGWFDTNKNGSGGVDRVLCSGAVASNMLHWWLKQNQSYINKYLSENPARAILPGSSSQWKNLNTYLSSFHGQNSSKIFEMYKLYYGHTKGIWADSSVDFFINGYKQSLTGATNLPEKFTRDERGGFFHEVFGKEKLTNRYFSGNYDEFSDSVMKELQKGNIIGISHKTASNKANHIITLWGADFNEQGKIIGIYIYQIQMTLQSQMSV